MALPIDGERAFVTVQSDARIDLDAVAALAPRAIVVNLPLPGRMPSGAWIYGVVGDPQVAILRDEGPRSLSELRALVLNEREARDITGRSDTVAAAAELAARGCLVVMTRGALGAVVADTDGSILESAAVRRNAEDTVGAGDLFTAAFIWADLLGRSVEDRLNLANAYASLSLAQAVPRQKGLAAAAFREALGEMETPMDRLLEV